MRGRNNSNSERLPNPSSKFLTWKGSEKSFLYYDKEKGEDVKYDLGKFLVLTTRASITGWSDENTAKIWSNEIGSTKSDKLHVRAGNTVIAEGMYSDIKDKVKAEGGKYQSVVYAYVLKTKELVRFALTGGALKAYMDYLQENNLRRGETVTLEVTGSETRKKGSVKYEVPTFSHEETNSKDDAAAEAFVSSLEEYLESLNFTTNTEEDITIESQVEETVEDSDGLPF